MKSSRSTRRPKNKRGYKDLDFEKRARNAVRVRLWLTAMILVLVSFEIGLYCVLPELKRSEILAVLIVRPLWSVALLMAIWFRQRWARFALLGLLLLSVLLNFAGLHSIYPIVSVESAVAVSMALVSVGVVILLFTEDFREYLSHVE